MKIDVVKSDTQNFQLRLLIKEQPKNIYHREGDQLCLCKIRANVCFSIHEWRIPSQEACCEMGSWLFVRLSVCSSIWSHEWTKSWIKTRFELVCVPIQQRVFKTNLDSVASQVTARGPSCETGQKNFCHGHRSHQWSQDYLIWNTGAPQANLKSSGGDNPNSCPR